MKFILSQREVSQALGEYVERLHPTARDPGQASIQIDIYYLDATGKSFRAEVEFKNTDDIGKEQP